MTAGAIRTLGGLRVLVCAEHGLPFARESDIGAFLGDAWAGDAAWVALPVSRLAPAFFQLRSGFAGAAVQKFVNYRMGLAVVGDLSPWLAVSEALRDFVREANRGAAIWFVGDLAGLERRLAALAPAAAAAAR